jgi:hypothetical protein
MLTSLKQNPTHMMHGHIFHMSQSNVSKWAPLVHGALNDALSQHHLLPARTADDLVRRLHEEPSHEEPSHEEPSHEEPSHEEPSHEEPSHEEPSHATKAPPFLSMTA